MVITKPFSMRMVLGWIGDLEAPSISLRDTLGSLGFVWAGKNMAIDPAMAAIEQPIKSRRPQLKSDDFMGAPFIIICAASSTLMLDQGG
jgi:hypothetical protein